MKGFRVDVKQVALRSRNWVDGAISLFREGGNGSEPVKCKSSGYIEYPRETAEAGQGDGFLVDSGKGLVDGSQTGEVAAWRIDEQVDGAGNAIRLGSLGQLGGELGVEVVMIRMISMEEGIGPLIIVGKVHRGA